MESIVTEKATDRWDLPHTVEIVDHQRDVCRCTRYTNHALHAPVILEQASSRETIVTEKGII